MLHKAFILASALAWIAPVAHGQTDSSQNVAGEEARESPESELRKPRVWALSAEIGLNSLGSLTGPVATWYVKPQIALDLGVGLSSGGLRPGLRARYLFSREKVSYFGGLGLKYGLGSGGELIEVEDPDTKKKFKIEVDGSGYVDASLGVEYLADNGFLVIANAGYSQLWGGVNFHVAEGDAASDEAIKLYKAVLGSGIMLSVSLGKAF
ncbi:MAG: hypothetical protein ABIW76_01045 [Fibrobacteria bacterium]